MKGTNLGTLGQEVLLARSDGIQCSGHLGACQWPRHFHLLKHLQVGEAVHQLLLHLQFQHATGMSSFSA